MRYAGLHSILHKELTLPVIFVFFILHQVESQNASSVLPSAEAFPSVSTPSDSTKTNHTPPSANFSSWNSTAYVCEFAGVGELPTGGAREVAGVILVLVVFGTIFGNLLVILSVLMFHELQTITNMFVASLACADLIMGAFVMPIGIPYVLNGRWLLGSFFCKVWVSIDVLTVTASIETLCAIALDRYLAITKPFKYTSSVTRSKAKCFIAFIWITSAGIAFIPIQLGWWKDTSMEAQCCYNNSECCEFITNETYAVVSSSVSFYIPLFIMIFSYSIVFKEAIRLASQIDSQTGYIRRASMPGTNRPLWSREQRRTIFTFGLIMGIFTACWLPFFIVNLTQVFCDGCIPSSVFATLNWIGYANSFFNPFIYSHNAQFRQAFVRLLTCLPCSEGFERTKRASLSDTFPRYRDSQRESTLHMITTFFLNGGSSRKRSTRRSDTSSTIILKRDSTMSRGSPTRSPNRIPRFRLGSDDFDICSTDNNNDFGCSDDYKRNEKSFQPSEISASSINRSKENGIVCFSEECHKNNGNSKRCSCNTNGFHRCLECEDADSPLLPDAKIATDSIPLSFSQRSPRYSLVGEAEFLTFDSNGNGNHKFPPNACNGIRQIRTRRSKSLFVTPHNIDVMNRVRDGMKQNANTSCSNFDHTKVVIESNMDSEASPLLVDKEETSLTADSSQNHPQEEN